MGVNALMLLPGNCRVDNVARVAGKCFGFPHEGESVVGVRVAHTTSGYANIHLESHDFTARIVYWFEADEQGCWRELRLGKSSADRLALGVRLANFFGGKVTFSDHWGGYDYVVPNKPSNMNSPRGGDDADHLWERIKQVNQITREEVDFYQPFAAVKENNYPAPSGSPFQGSLKPEQDLVVHTLAGIVLPQDVSFENSYTVAAIVVRGEALTRLKRGFWHVVSQTTKEATFTGDLARSMFCHLMWNK